MADFFRGVQNYFDPSGKPERDLDRMLDAYAKGGKEHAKTADGMRTVMGLSPDLKERVLEAVRDGYISGFTPENPGDNAAAGYSARSRQMHIRPDFDGKGSSYAELMFAMGHETDHARSLKGQSHLQQMLHPLVAHIAEQPASGARNYTGAIELYVDTQRAEEAQAHIGGFNAMASYAMTYGKAPKGKELQTMYEIDPLRMGDFIKKSGDPAQYALKDGLSVDANFQMPKTPENINAMKVYYADKMINGDYMMYRQEAIQSGIELVGRIESIHAKANYEDRAYIIDPVAVRAHPSLNMPQNGQYEIKEAIPVMDLGAFGIDLSVLDQSLPKKSQASSSGPLDPAPNDHPLFAQALTKVAEYDGGGRLAASPQELRNLAAALAVEAEAGGIKQIDGVMLNKDKSGLIATEGSGFTSLNALVDMSAKSVDEHVSLAKLTPVQQLASSSQSHQDPLVQNHSNAVQKI